MIDAGIEKLCEEVRETWHCETPPVDLVHIAAEEGIELAPGHYSPSFHGLLEYVPDERLFVLYYPDRFSGSAQVRVRFTIAHEFGHYYLPNHRAALMAGDSPKCEVGFLSDKEMEREADSFAASLLIPQSIMQKRIDRHGMMTVAAVIDIASQFKVSVPCAIIRYVQYASEACAVVLSEQGKVKYYIPSDEMGEIGCRYMSRGQEIPRDSAAWSLLSNEEHRTVKGKKVDGRQWYPKRIQSLDLWEDSYSLGYGAQVITLLSSERF